MTPLTAVVVGPGGWVRTALVPALRAAGGVDIRGCVAATEAEARAACADLDLGPAAVAADSFEETVDQIGVPDIVVIATPDHLHAAYARAALAAGSAVYCEKPLANDPATAWDLARLAETAARPATVGFSFRFNPALQALRADLQSGRLGAPWLVELHEHNTQFHPAHGRAMTWKGDPAQSGGGALFEYGAHVIDLAQWLVGPVRRVSAALARVLPGARLDDIASLQLRHDGGVIGTLLASWVLDGGFPGIRIRLHASEAMGEVVLDDRLPGGQVYRLHDPHGRATEPKLAAMDEPRGDAARRHMAAFVAAVQGGDTASLPSFADGARVQDVLGAALAAQDRWIDVAEDPVR